MGEQVNSPARILTASLVGTTIEFFDFYIFATAAVLVFPHLFFPTSDPTSAVLQSFATFSIAFFARPLGAAVFGHYGDRIGRKATLVAALMTMGLSTVMIGFLPGYDTVGVFAPLLLAICRFGQGLGLGGEWGGAVLLATENAPPHRRSWYAMFPQLGAPLGFVLSATSFLLLTETLTNEQFLSWGWRIPFVSSLLLVLLGLYVRLKITETPEFQKAVDTEARVAVPILDLLRSHKRALLLGTLVALATFVLFYLMTVFSLSWATSKLGYSRERYLEIQLIGVAFFAATIPLAAWLSDRYGRRTVLLIATGLHRRVRPFLRTAARLWPCRRAGLQRRRPRPDGLQLRADRRGAGIAVSGLRALYRRLDDLQPRRHIRGVAGALHRDLARAELLAGLGGLLPAGGLSAHAGGHGDQPGRRAVLLSRAAAIR